MKIESYIQGTPCWVDLSTSDQDAAKSFYAELFGWTYDDNPMDESGNVVYSMAMKGDSYTGAIYTQPQEQAQMGIPPHWMVHIAVDSADEIASRVEGCGGKVVAGPFDVFENGRMVFVTDPTGGMVNLWQGKTHAGAGVQHEHGAIGWCELLSTDPAAAIQFYTSLLGVESETAMMPNGVEYTAYMAGDMPLAGTMEMPPEVKELNIPSHWSVYFDVEDVDETYGKAMSMGGHEGLAPTDIETVGRLAFVIDPQGAGFGLMTPLAESGIQG